MLIRTVKRVFLSYSLNKKGKQKAKTKHTEGEGEGEGERKSESNSFMHWPNGGIDVYASSIDS